MLLTTIPSRSGTTERLPEHYTRALAPGVVFCLHDLLLYAPTKSARPLSTPRSHMHRGMMGRQDRSPQDWGLQASCGQSCARLEAPERYTTPRPLSAYTSHLSVGPIAMTRQYSPKRTDTTPLNRRLRASSWPAPHRAGPAEGPCQRASLAAPFGTPQGWGPCISPSFPCSSR